jgi:hypothetical protein
MSDTDYDDILNQSFDDLQDDKILPLGDWVLKLRNAAFIPPKSENSNARVLFFYTPVEPVDVDETEMGALGEDYDFTENQIVFQVWIEGNRSWRDVKSHLGRHKGVDLTGGTIRDVLKKGVKGAEVMAYLDERSFENAFGELVTENSPSRFRPLD